MNKLLALNLALAAALSIAKASDAPYLAYPIVDTAQTACYDARSEIAAPHAGEAYFGQDAQYAGPQPDYRDNGDGTVSDQVTGLMWTQDPGEKLTYQQALQGAASCRVGDYEDWRLPSIKELYSLIRFDGIDPGPQGARGELRPFIDSSVFDFAYGDESKGERIIDSQFASSTKYASLTMGGNETLFGVNFADGRIKGYPISSRRGDKTFHVLYVRGNPDYGINRFVDQADGTIADLATGLTWMKADSGSGMNWPDALEYAENLAFAGHDDWRLPNAKELQSIIDYSRSPDSTDSAAIDAIFEVTPILNEGGARDYPHYWSSTTHLGPRGGDTAAYFAFGRGLGFMTDRRSGQRELLDVHGAGSQRSDPKIGDASRFPYGRGPQGDVIRIQNFVRCVRGGTNAPSEPQPPNIILILADDMGWTGSSVQMDPQIKDSKSDFYETPQLERLASQGMRFSQAYAPAALCTPSRAGILTGKTPAELRMTTPGRSKPQAYHKLLEPEHVRELPREELTVAELLQSKGYATAHFGKWHLGRVSPSEHGFDAHDGASGNAASESESTRNPKDIVGITDRAIAFMDTQARKHTPFYLQLSHYAVHAPIQASQDASDRFAAKPIGSRHTDRAFAAMTYDLDASIGRLLEALDTLGLAENTFVVFLSDNGASGKPRHPQNDPLNGGKGSLYEGGIRVPLIIRGPGIAPAAHSSTSVTGCDLLPTFASWAGADTPEGLAGGSLAPLLAGKDEKVVRADDALLFHYPHYGQGPRQTPQSALIVGDFKLLKELETGESQLFNLKEDPYERSDLSSKQAELKRVLNTRLEEALTAAQAQVPIANPDYDPDATPQGRGRNR